MKMCESGFCGFLGWERGLFLNFGEIRVNFLIFGWDFKSICAGFVLYLLCLWGIIVLNSTAIKTKGSKESWFFYFFE